MVLNRAQGLKKKSQEVWARKYNNRQRYNKKCRRGGGGFRPPPGSFRVKQRTCTFWKLIFVGNLPISRKQLLWVFTLFKGCGMDPWLVLVSPCFRENVVATCKIGSFLCSLDNLLGKPWLFSFLEIKLQNGAHLKKGLFLTYFSHFLVTREKLQKFLQHISHSHTYTYFAHPIDLFCLTNFEKNTNLSDTVSLWYVILIHAILEQSINYKLVSKI